VDGFSSVAELMASKKEIGMAIVAVPHAAYLPIISQLAGAGVHIFKEKPFATTCDEAVEIDRVVRKNKVRLMVNVQRRFNPVFQAFLQLRRRIGKIYKIEGRYVKNIDRLDVGWRANFEVARGGAMMDMGYHFVDLLMWYFGLPKSVAAQMTNLGRAGQIYDVEDTADLTFHYANGGGALDKTVGHFTISRAGFENSEVLDVYGSNGRVLLQRGKISRFDRSGKEVESLSREGQWPSAAVDQLEYFADAIAGKEVDVGLSYTDHFQHVAIIESAYEANRISASVDPSSRIR
jgi:predicted dehydrogenase